MLSLLELLMTQQMKHRQIFLKILKETGHLKGAATKNFCHAYQILAIKGVGGGIGGGEGGGESVKTGKFITKIFFQIMLNEVVKICEK